MQLEKIIDLPVYTENGYYLGRVIKVEVDPQTGQATNYVVRSSNFIKNLFRGTLVISERQVISISPEKMVVEEAWKKMHQPAPGLVR